MIPLWKLRRELQRLKVQAQALPMALYEPFVQTRHDRARAERVTVTQGALPATERMAVFLLYQPNGVNPSVLATCRHLVQQGFSPIVVSNTPLSSGDRIALMELVHLVAERPNFGYDFGGYRDGLWLIKERKIKPEQLLFLNDSVWFPVRSDTSLLTDMSQSPADYVGTQVFGDVSPSVKRQGFFGSYCFLIKAPLLNSDAFNDFWTHYRMSSNKEVTLRRGERAFSHQMLRASDRSAGIFSHDRYHAVIDGLNTSALREALGDMVVLRTDLEERRQALLKTASTVSWDDDAQSLLREAARSKNYIGAAPVISLRELGFPMIKKNNEMLYREARKRIITAVDEGRLVGLDAQVLGEMRTLIARTKTDDIH